MTKIEMEKSLENMTKADLESLQWAIINELTNRKKEDYNNLIKDIADSIDNIIALGYGDCLAIDYVDGDDQWTWVDVADWFVTEYRKKEG